MRFGMRLVWFRKVTLCGFCVHCKLYSRIHLANFMLVFSFKNPHKWHWPVKAISEIIKLRPKVFCWSCDKDPFKWDKKICRGSSLSLRIEWVYSRLSFRNGRSIPLIVLYLFSMKWGTSKKSKVKHVKNILVEDSISVTCSHNTVHREI